jgi:hypothetical protein
MVLVLPLTLFSQHLGSVKLDLARYANENLSVSRNRVQLMLDGGIASGTRFSSLPRSLSKEHSVEPVSYRVCLMFPVMAMSLDHSSALKITIIS